MEIKDEYAQSQFERRFYINELQSSKANYLTAKSFEFGVNHLHEKHCIFQNLFIFSSLHLGLTQKISVLNINSCRH